MLSGTDEQAFAQILESCDGDFDKSRALLLEKFALFTSKTVVNHQASLSIAAGETEHLHESMETSSSSDAFFENEDDDDIELDPLNNFNSSNPPTNAVSLLLRGYGSDGGHDDDDITVAPVIIMTMMTNLIHKSKNMISTTNIMIRTMKLSKYLLMVLMVTLRLK